jgi:hypothetical protein
MVPVYGGSFDCTLLYDHDGPWNCSHPEYSSRLDMKELGSDIRGFRKFLGVNRKICFNFNGVLPDDIRAKAHVAKELGFSVWLICDAEGQWNCEYIPADPLLVAEVAGSFLFLGAFDPTPLETWAQQEMVTPFLH